MPATAAGVLLLDFLVRRFPYHGRDRWIEELAAGRVQVAGRPASASTVLRRGDDLAYEKQHREPWVDDRISILHEDAAVFVVDKPAHLPMHADGPFVRSTLIHLLRQRTGSPELALVHRLDRETSGVCVVPRTAASRASLHRQFESATVRKEYTALVAGTVAGAFTIDTPIGRAPGSTVSLRRTAGPDALAPQPAATSFETLRQGKGGTLLRCVPHTGRTHQIRVHLASIGLPILGDKLYGRSDEAYLAFVRAVKRSGDPRLGTDSGPHRQLLHASALSFTHPETGATVTFHAPLPTEFEQWLAGEGGAVGG